MEGKKYLFPEDYMADPAAHVFNGKLYIYPSHDWEAGAEEDDDGGHFQMKDYHALSFDDLENGKATDHGVIFSVEQVPWAEKQLWDSDVVEKDGKYYYVFSAKGYDGVFRLGVAVADKPEGPFTPRPFAIRGSFSIDPCVFKDDDGTIYTYFGGLWGGQLQWWQPLYHGFETIPGKYGDKNGLIDLGPAPDRKTQLFAKPDAPALPSWVVKMNDDMEFAEAPRCVLILDKDGQPDVSYEYAVDPVIESYHVVGEKVLPSIGEIYDEAARWPERELNEIFGIEFEGLDVSKRLFLPEDMLETQGKGQIMVMPLKELREKNIKEAE